MLGSVLPAARGALTVLVSGDVDVFHRSRPLLERIGRLLFFLGEPGVATKMKLANNLVLATLMAGIAEAAAVAERSGIPRDKALDILAAGAGNSAVLAARRESLLAEDFSPHFSAALLYKDLHYLQDLARTQKRPLFTAAAVKELYALAFPRGVEGQDFPVIAKLLGGWAG